MKRLKKRDAKHTKGKILEAAELEFANKGLYGARIDAIAERADVNKRMIYEYFGNKEQLYGNVLEMVYGRLTAQELSFEWSSLTAGEAVKKIIDLYFQFLENNESYVNLILWENLNKGAYIKKMDIAGPKAVVFEEFRSILDKGVRTGEFRSDLDHEQILLSLLTFTFSYFSNRYTLTGLLQYDFTDPINMEKRKKIVTDMMMQYIRSS